MASLTIKAEVHAECTGRRFHFKTNRGNSNSKVALAPILNCKRGSRQENITAVNGLASRRLVYLVTRPVSCPFNTLKSRNRSSCITVEGMASAGMGAQQYVATVGAPPSIPLPSAPSGVLPANAVLLFLGFIASSVIAALSLLLLAALPALKAIRQAAESIEELANTAREELPATMAAVRLSGMEISDLTMELSDLSSEISEGVRSSARAVQAAEDGIRRIGTIASSRTLGLLQTHATNSAEVVRPAVASAARTSRKAIAGARERVAQLSVLKRGAWWLGSVLRHQRKEKNDSLQKGAS